MKKNTKTKKEILKKVLALAKRFYIHSQGEKRRKNLDKNNTTNSLSYES